MMTMMMMMVKKKKREKMRTDMIKANGFTCDNSTGQSMFVCVSFIYRKNEVEMIIEILIVRLTQ